MQEEGILARNLARRYLAASEHDQGSTLWMQSNIMDHIGHHEISVEIFWKEVAKQRRLYDEPVYVGAVGERNKFWNAQYNDE